MFIVGRRRGKKWPTIKVGPTEKSGAFIKCSADVYHWPAAGKKMADHKGRPHREERRLHQM
jgi:hypothetical protein